MSTVEMSPSDIELIVRQNPIEGLVTSAGKEKHRKPLDPPPIVEMRVSHSADPQREYLQNPYLLMTCNVVNETTGELVRGRDGAITLGQTSSSLHRLKDHSNKDGGFFVFGDVSLKATGTFRLHFHLFELKMRHQPPRCVFLKDIYSEPFRVVVPKEFKGMDESTYLSRAFSDQGVRLRLRKEPRAYNGKKRSHSSMQNGQDDVDIYNDPNHTWLPSASMDQPVFPPMGTY